MRKFIRFVSNSRTTPAWIVCLAVLVLTAGTALAGDNAWTSYGPFGGSITSVVKFAATPNAILVGSWGGVWRTTNPASANWTAANGLTTEALNYTTVTSLVSLPVSYVDRVFAGTIGGGIYMGVPHDSSNALTTNFSTADHIAWTQVNSGLTNFNISGLAVSGGMLFAATEYGGVFKCADAEAATPVWTEINTGLTTVNQKSIRGIYVDTTPATDVVYIGTAGGGIYSRAVSGTTWAAVGTSPTAQNINTVLAYSSSYVVIGTDLGGVYTYNGTAWSELKLGGGNPLSTSIGADVTSLALYVDTDGPTYYNIVGTDKEGIWLFHPVNGWSSLSSTSALITNTHVRDLNFGVYSGGPPPTAFNSIDGRVYANTTDWPVASMAIAAATWAGIYTNTYAGGWGGWTDVTSTSTFAPISSTRAYSIAYLQTNPAITGTVFSGTHGSGVFKKTPTTSATVSANEWSKAYTSTTALDLDVYAVAVDPRTNRVYAGSGSEGVFLSTDGGSSWSANGLAGKDVRTLVIDPTNSSTIYAGTWEGVYKTTNGGTSWTLSTDLANKLTNSLTVSPVSATTLYAGTYNGVYKTTNGGTSWTAVNTGLTTTNVQAVVLDTQSSTTVYAGTLGGGVFKTTNGGTSWTAMNYNLDNLNVYSLAVDPLASSVIYAGTDGGMIYKSMDSGTNWAVFAPRLVDLAVPVRSEVRALTIVRLVDQLILFAGTNGNGIYEIRLPSMMNSGPTEIVSTDSSGILGNGMSYNGKVSMASAQDGRYVAFQSIASNLVTSDTNGFMDIFVKDRVTGKTVRISVSSAGTQANGDSYTPTISQDGRYVAFASQATNLVSGDTNGVADIFVHDRDTDANGTYDETGKIATIRVSIHTNGNQANNYSLTPSISDDGRFVAFTSFATNLVADTTVTATVFAAAAGGSSQVFVRDRLGANTSAVFDASGYAVTRLVSSTNDPLTPGGGNSSLPSVSGDGAFIAFQTRATTLNGTGLGATGLKVVFTKVHDGTGTLGSPFTTYIANPVAATDATPNYGDDGGFNFSPVSISGKDTGTSLYTIAFYAVKDPSAPGVAVTPAGQVYSCTTVAAGANCSTWTVISVKNGFAGAIANIGTGGVSGTYGVSISEDATRVAFTSLATNLVGDLDTGGVMDIYVRTLATNVTTRHSVASDGSQGNQKSELPALSANGNFMAFHSWSNNLVAGDSNNTVDVFVARVVTTTSTTVTSASTTTTLASGPAIRTVTGCYTAGYGTTVTVKVTPTTGTQVYTLEETVPPGWIVAPADINQSGTWDGTMGKVRWGPFYDSVARTFTYKVTSLSSDTGDKYITGQLSLDSTRYVVGGSGTLKDNCSLHPADTNKDMRLEAGEITAYAYAWITGAVWAVPPNPIPLNYVARAGYLWRNGELYSYDSTKAAPDCWIVPTTTTTAAAPRPGLIASARSAGTVRTAVEAPDGIGAGLPVEVTMAVNPPTHATAFTAEQAVPYGWRVIEVSDGGRWDARSGKVKWGPIYGAAPHSLTFKAIPARSGSGRAALSGIVSFDGSSLVPSSGEVTFSPER